MPLNHEPRIGILFCVQDLRGRGAERVLATLLRGLDRTKYRTAVFVFHDDFTVKIPPDVAVVSAHLESYPPSAGIFLKLRMNIRKVAALGRALRAQAPAVAISVSGTNIPIILAKRLFRLKTRVILSEHTLPSAFTPDTGGALSQFLTRRLISLTYPLADHVVVPSPGVSADLSRNYGVPPGKLVVIPNPLDVEAVRNSANEAPGFPLPDGDRFTIGFVGGLSREKNVPCLLRAFAALLRKGAPVRLFIVGKGIEEGNLRALSADLGIEEQVRFLGYRDNPYPILKRFDILVIPSFYEVFPYVMLEAMACGVPVVSSNWPGCADLYTHDENCLLFPVNDDRRLAEAIERVMTDDSLARALVESGLEFVRQYDARKVVERYESLIRQCASA